MEKTIRFEPNEPSVVSETIDGESVIINLDTGIYYSLQRTAATVWEMIEQRHTVADILAQIEARFAHGTENPDAPVELFLAQLTDEALIREAANAPDGAEAPGMAAVDPAAPRLPFEPPVLNRYSDMEDLLLLDPIHEVDETGWPQMK